MIQYLLDANVFIQAKRFHYPFDVFPGFWEWLERDMEAGILASVDPVHKELTEGNDELVQWACDRQAKGCFLAIDDDKTQMCYGELASWVVDPIQQFTQPAYEQFLAVGDSWLIAKALSLPAIIVTHERYDANCRKRVLIPNVCRSFGIECIDTIELIRRMGTKFRLA